MFGIYRRKLTRLQAEKLAKELCRQKGWVYRDPIRLIPGVLSWTIETNAHAVGCNARITVSRFSGKVVRAGYLAR